MSMLKAPGTQGGPGRETTSVSGLFFKYVYQNVMGMVGISVYILADTFFISVAEGAEGIATLNLALPIYSFIFAIGSMLGVGSGIRYSIFFATGNRQADTYFSNAIEWACILSLPFMLTGLWGTPQLLRLCGGDEAILRLGVPYLRIVLIFAPAFMLNYIFNAFTRNDGAPTRAMIATLSGSIFNITFDYVFMFPMGMGMTGAALATSISPLLGVLICSTHIFSKKSHVRLVWGIPSVGRLLEACQLGVSAFVGEFGSGVTTMVYNFLILGISGNNGVAAYGVVANISLVVIAVLNGISQGGQPLLSHFYGMGEHRKQQKILNYSLALSVCFGAIMIVIFWMLPEPIAQVFNSENNPVMLAMAITGVRLYFLGTIFAGLNIVITGYFGAVEQGLYCSIVSILRGAVLISLCAVVLSILMGMNGIWLSFPVAEGLTLLVAGFLLIKF